MADHDHRVTPHRTLLGNSGGATPERIAELQQRAREVERLRRPKPTRSFADVLSAEAAADDSDPDTPPQLTAKQKKLLALPKKGPHPQYVHPAQRDALGREADPDEAVILKG